MINKNTLICYSVFVILLFCLVIMLLCLCYYVIMSKNKRGRAIPAQPPNNKLLLPMKKKDEKQFLCQSPTPLECPATLHQVANRRLLVDGLQDSRSRHLINIVVRLLNRHLKRLPHLQQVEHTVS